MKAYDKMWEKYLAVSAQVEGMAQFVPISVQDLERFIAHLFREGYASSTIRSHVSAISFRHKVRDSVDPAQSARIARVLQGCQNSRPSFNPRLPITPEILEAMCGALEHVIPEYRLRITVKAMFLLAFHAFLRIGEICVKQSEDSVKVIQRGAVQVPVHCLGGGFMTITICYFKSNFEGRPFSISVPVNQPVPRLCPVLALKQYLALPHQGLGPLFTYKGRSFTKSFFAKLLKDVLDFLHLDTLLYTGHSFRIGAATAAASRGVPDQVIKSLGRWKSDAYKQYIRIAHTVTP